MELTQNKNREIQLSAEKPGLVEEKKFPVLITMFTRHWNVAKLVEALRNEKPEKIYVSSDGPRTKDQEVLVQKCRDEIDKIDWPCHVIKLYRSENAGIYVAGAEAKDLALSENEGIVGFEDDCIPDDAYFDFLRYIDKIFGDDDSVPIYCGSNPLGSTPGLRKQNSAVYSLSRRARVWGHYVKAEFWREFREADLRIPFSIRECVQIASYTPGLISKLLKFRMLIKLRKSMGKGDIAMNYFLAKSKRMAVISSTNLVTNVGYGSDATHTKYLPDIKFSQIKGIDYGSKKVIKGKYMRRVDILDGWLLLIWWISSKFQRPS